MQNVWMQDFGDDKWKNILDFPYQGHNLNKRRKSDCIFNI